MPISDDEITLISSADVSLSRSSTAGLVVPNEFHIEHYAVHPLEAEISILTGMLFEKSILVYEAKGRALLPRLWPALHQSARSLRLKSKIASGDTVALESWLALKTSKYEQELELLHHRRIHSAITRRAPHEYRHGDVVPVAVLSRQAWIASRAKGILNVGDQNKQNWHRIKALLDDFYECARRQPDSAHLVREGEMLLGATIIFAEYEEHSERYDPDLPV